MVYFTIRIELHGATGAGYTQLHKNLADIGLTDIIADDAGTRYRMPPGEYNYQGDVTIQQVLAAAQAAATKTNRKWAVFVSEATRRLWNGLPTIQ